jgi:hypothetical protein
MAEHKPLAFCAMCGVTLYTRVICDVISSRLGQSSISPPYPLDLAERVGRPFVRSWSLVVRGLSRAARPHLDLGIGSAIDADLKIGSALTEKLYGDLRRNFFDGFLHFLGGTR